MNNWQFTGLMIGFVGVIAALITTLLVISTRIDGLYTELSSTQSYLSQRIDSLDDSLGGRMDVITARIDNLYPFMRIQYETQRLQQEIR